MLLLDSSAIIELLYDTPKGKKITEAIGSELAATTAVNIHELARAATSKELAVLSNIFSGMEVFPYDKDCAFISSKLGMELKKQGKEINELDLFIAGIGIKNKVTIATLDKHFSRVKELNTKIF